MSRNKLHLDYLTNVLFSFVKPVGALWAIKLATIYFEPVSLGVFLYTRRFCNTGAALLQVGVSQTLIKYLSIYHDKTRAKSRYVIFSVIVMMSMISFLSIILFYVIGQDYLYKTLFPNINIEGELLFWTVIMLYAYVLVFISSAVLLAERNMLIFNVYQLLVNSGFVILLLLFYSTIDVVSMIKYQAIAFLLVSVVVLIYFFNKTMSAKRDDHATWKKITSDYFFYGLPRGMFSALDMVLFFIGPWLMRGDIEQAGYFMIALIVLKLVQSVVLPIGQLSSVVVGQLSSKENEDSIMEGIQVLFFCIVAVMSVFMVGIISWSDFLLTMWLGADVSRDVSPYLNVLLYAVLPYALYQGFSGIIDIRWDRPLNLYIVGFGILLYLVVYYLLLNTTIGLHGVTTAFVVSVYFIGIMITYLLRPYIRQVQGLGLFKFLLLIASLSAVNIFLSTEPNILKLILSVLLSAMLVYMYVVVWPSPYVKWVFLRLTNKAGSA